MSYTYTADPKPAFLHFKVTGENSPEAVRGYLADVQAACARHQRSHVLVEEHLAGPSLSPTDVFTIVTEAAGRTWPAIRKIAFVDTNRAHDASLMSFAETVAINRGVNIRVFADTGSAETWLTANT